MAARLSGARRRCVSTARAAARTLSTTLFALSLISLASPLPLLAQSGTLRGWVRDGNGAALAGMQLEARAQGGSLRFATATGADGSYQLLQLPAGVYDVTVIDEADRNVCPRGVDALSVRDYELKELVLVVSGDGSCEFVTLDGQPAPAADSTAATGTTASPGSKRKAWIIALGSLAGVVAAVALLDSDDDPPATPSTP